MKSFYLLGRIDISYDTVDTIIVCAESEEEARQSVGCIGYNNKDDCFVDPTKSSCKVLDIKDYESGEIVFEFFQRG